MALSQMVGRSRPMVAHKFAMVGIENADGRRVAPGLGNLK